MSMGQVLKGTFFCHLEEQVGIVTMDWEQTSSNPTRSLNAADIAVVQADITAQIPLLIRSCLAQEAEYDGMKLRLWSLQASLDVEASSSAGSGAGGAANEGYAPRQLAGLIRKITATPSRRGRGRLYVPFPPFDAFTVEGQTTAAYNLNLVQLAEGLAEVREVMIDGVAATFAPCVSGQSRPGSGILVTSMPVAPQFATQRRRGAFGRPNTPIFS